MGTDKHPDNRATNHKFAKLQTEDPLKAASKIEDAIKKAENEKNALAEANSKAEFSIILLILIALIASGVFIAKRSIKQSRASDAELLSQTAIALTQQVAEIPDKYFTPEAPFIASPTLPPPTESPTPTKTPVPTETGTPWERNETAPLSDYQNPTHPRYISIVPRDGYVQLVVSPGSDQFQEEAGRLLVFDSSESNPKDREKWLIGILNEDGTYSYNIPIEYVTHIVGSREVRIPQTQLTIWNSDRENFGNSPRGGAFVVNGVNYYSDFVDAPNPVPKDTFMTIRVPDTEKPDPEKSGMSVPLRNRLALGQLRNHSF